MKTIKIEIDGRKIELELQNGKLHLCRSEKRTSSARIVATTQGARRAEAEGAPPVQKAE